MAAPSSASRNAVSALPRPTSTAASRATASDSVRRGRAGDRARDSGCGRSARRRRGAGGPRTERRAPVVVRAVRHRAGRRHAREADGERLSGRRARHAAGALRPPQGEHGGLQTFGGNPVAARAALAVLDVIEDERLIENAARVGAELRLRSRIFNRRSARPRPARRRRAGKRRASRGDREPDARRRRPHQSHGLRATF